MKIGIIGAGQIGGALTRRFTALGHQVFVANSRGPGTLAGLARETGASPVSVTGAARSGDVVVVTIPIKMCLACIPASRQRGRRRHRELLPAAAGRPY